MKKITLLLFLALGFISCVKQSDCENGFIGTLQYLETPLYIEPHLQFKKEKVIALFNYGEQNLYITGYIPIEYKSKEPIPVKASIKALHDNYNGILHDVGSPVYRIKCIEKVD